ncbi:Phosphocholine hydrolase Lem3 [Legionella gratiana]|uniref:Phosphocholine hydrolase Lem3 n=1 Tax=Legionella gratiana TaxID=45066 RepID=A0A378J5E2_9GAMM|nr:hypothetical protein [Legionella gratiana]KTD06148.1 Phosphocholine hydrolase Lem3 [Legionella gratiana]STX42962.1 Uncharacterised protein [Legionella gratiana]
MRDKVITSKNSIFAPSISKDNSIDLVTFLSKRFYSVNHSHNSAIITGSSLAYGGEDLEHDTILDSAGVSITKNKLGVINGARVAVTDGLGGGVGDQEEDNNIHKVAYSTCEAFLDSKKNIDATLNLINLPTSSSRKLIKLRPEDAHASMAAFIYNYDSNKGYSGEFVNVGDGLIIVLDKQLKMKHTICARHIYRGFGQWTPPSVQMLESAPDRNKLIIKQTLELDEGDIIVSMTDGIWGEFESNLISQTTEQRDIAIDRLTFEALFDQLKGKQNPSTFEIAELITRQAMSKSLERRKILLKLIDDIEQECFPQKEIKTIKEVLDYCANHGRVELANTLKSILFEQGMNDGVVYFIDKVDQIPLDIVMQDLTGRCVGDCSTINVTRVPHHLDELVRCFITNPENHRTLATFLKAAIKSELDLKETFERLALEMRQIEVESNFSEAIFEPVFKKETLNKAQKLLTHYFRISTHLDSERSYEKRLTYVTRYLTQEAVLEKNDIDSLLSMLHSQIKPKIAFKTFFQNQNKLYNKFLTEIATEIDSAEPCGKQCK